jgi:lambda repressor-like predicted transcriptional regulator
MSTRFADSEDIKAEIRRRDQSLTTLSRGLGFTASAISRRFTMDRAWPLLDERLADFLGTTKRELFPKHYDRHDRPIGIVRRQNTTRPFDPRLCPNLARKLAA